MDRARERKKLDERIYEALSYANEHPDMEAYMRGLESQAEFNAAVDEIMEIDGGFELDIPSLELDKMSRIITHNWYTYQDSKLDKPIAESLELIEVEDNDNSVSIPTMSNDEYMTELSHEYETFDIYLYGDTNPLHAA